jgi:hypothetical protein
MGTGIDKPLWPHDLGCSALESLVDFGRTGLHRACSQISRSKKRAKKYMAIYLAGNDMRHTIEELRLDGGPEIFC